MVGKLLLFDEDLYQRLKAALKMKNNGKIKGLISEKINSLIKQELEHGELQFYDKEHKNYKENKAIIDEITAADVENEDHEIKFLKGFDNHSDVYPLMKLPVIFLKSVIKDIVGKDTDYMWRKYSKILKSNHRIKQIEGTQYYNILIQNFKYKEGRAEDAFEDAAIFVHKCFEGCQITVKDVTDSLMCNEKTAIMIVEIMTNKEMVNQKARGIWQVG